MGVDFSGFRDYISWADPNEHLRSYPWLPAFTPAGFGFIPDGVWSLTGSVLRVPLVSSALAMAERRKFLRELSASLQIPRRGVKCSYFQLRGTDIYSCPDATASP